MSVLLETSVGDLVIDLDLEGSPVLCRNFLKLCTARYYTQSLIHHVVPNRFVLLGDPSGTGQGGASFFGLLSATVGEESSSHNDSDAEEAAVVNVEKMENRFLASSSGRRLTPQECQEKGRVVALELYGLQDTVGSQFLITTTSGPDRALDGYRMMDAEDSRQSTSASKPARGYLSLGKVVEDDQNILDRLADCYADSKGRPYADWRIKRALIVHDPYDNPRAMTKLLRARGVVLADSDSSSEKDRELQVVRSPSPVRPLEETVPPRVPVEEVAANIDPDDENGGIDPIKEREFQQEIQRKEDRSRAVVLEMLGDLPDADITAPENVLFICKLNSVTTDEDLQLIFSRFDEKVHVEIVRDHDSGQSLNYAFAEFTTPQQATQAYLKMNQALVDDRRIVVDFSQSVAKLWDRHRQRYRSSGKPKASSSSHQQAPRQGKRPRHY